MTEVPCKNCTSVNGILKKSDNYYAFYECKDCNYKWKDKSGRIVSDKSRGRERKRLSSETLEFKNRLDKFLESVDPEIAYSIKQDRKKMTDMEYYGINFPKIKFSLTPIERIEKYAIYLMEYGDLTFAEELLGKLNKQQSQTLRKAAPRAGNKKDKWEHVIPVKVVVNEILNMIKSGNINEIKHLLNLYQSAGQRAITNEDDRKLSPFKDCMPEDWNWRDKNVDVLARYKAVGINID